MKPLSTALLCIFVLAGCGGGGGSGGSGGSCGALNLKITGGEQCSAQDSPVVAIVSAKVEGSQTTPIELCTGTLVSLTSVVTAAHCIVDPAKQGANTIFIIAGSENRVMTRFAINPLYDGIVGSPFDVAMISVNEPLNISPVPLLITRLLAVGDTVSIFGYGKDSSGNIGDLRVGEMKVDVVAPGKFGASFDDTGSAICQGDSGGPALESVNGSPAMVGITSFTVNGCQTGSFSGFDSTQVNGNADFIVGYAPDASTL